MKKIVWVIVAFVFLAACTGKKEQPVVQDTTVVKDSIESDTLDMGEAEEVLPERADELFDDFIFNFSKDCRVQLCRMVSPLPYVKDGKKTFIKKKDWEYDPLFFDREFYAVIYDDERDMQLEKDTSLQKVRLEYLYLDRGVVKRYNFRRYKGLWILFDILEEPFREGVDCSDFLTFYEQFATDSVYQREHIHEPLKFVTIDPDDDFNVIETTIEVDQWFAFRPKLPQHTLTNVNYGQRYQNEKQKLLSLRGNGNGFNNTLTFEKQDEIWKLTCFEDTGD